MQTLSLIVYIARFSSTGLLYMQLHIDDTMYVYELEKYTQIQQLIMFTGKNKRNFDADFGQNYFVFTSYSSESAIGVFVVSSSGNKTLATQ
jgi:hypothetical protein